MERSQRVVTPEGVEVTAQIVMVRKWWFKPSWVMGKFALQVAAWVLPGSWIEAIIDRFAGFLGRNGFRAKINGVWC